MHFGLFHRQSFDGTKFGVAVVLLANVWFLGVGNLGVVNVRILGVINVLLANNSQSFENTAFRSFSSNVLYEMCPKHQY